MIGILPVGAVIAVSLLAACQSTSGADFRSLAEVPAAPYAVKVTGGAFVVQVGGEEDLGTTFGVAAGTGSHEAIPLARIVDVLRRSHAFVRVDPDERLSDERRRLAELRARPLVFDSPASELLDRAAADGYDYVLFVESIEDGPIAEYGVNARWPITAIAWLAVGIGVVIPDHTFESSARLRVSMRDVHSGEVVYRRVLDGDPVELSLIDRSDVWGVVQSILVPPFWVANDREQVARHVRDATVRRLLFLLAQDLKSVSCRTDLRAAAAMRLDVAAVERGLRIRCGGDEGLNLVRLQVDGVTWEPPGFHASLLGSVAYESEQVVYEAVCPRPAHGRFLQVLIQTIGGRVASSTVDLDALEGGG